MTRVEITIRQNDEDPTNFDFRLETVAGIGDATEREMDMAESLMKSVHLMVEAVATPDSPVRKWAQEVAP